MPKQILKVIGLLTIIAFTLKCDSDDKTGSLELIFKLTYQDAPLVMLDRHDLPVDVKAFFTRFSMYLSNLTISGDNAIALEDITFLNLTNDHSDLNGATNGTKVTYNGIPEGNYDNIVFEIGVPQELNAKTPIDFNSDHPLARSGEYWTGWKSYIFFKIEGQMDTDADENFETGIAFHIGSDDALRMKEMQSQFSVFADQQTKVEVYIDLYDILKSPTGKYDILGTPQIHRLDQLPQALELADNLINAVHL